MTESLAISVFSAGGGILATMVLQSIWKKSPMETDYVTEDKCKECRDECARQRQTEREGLREELRSVHRGIENLRQTMVEYMLTQRGGK